MQKFTERHADKVVGVLSCFDRLIFKGHLGLGFSRALEAFFHSRGLLHKDFKTFCTAQSDRLKAHAVRVAEKANRPFQYLRSHTRKEELAREIAARDQVTEGLVCVFSTVESCRSFALRYGDKKPRLAAADRKCLHLYFYYLDREFGCMHVRLQTWFPFQVQVYVNGHEWLTRKLDQHNIEYKGQDNAFTWIADPARAQKFADRLVGKNWPRILDAFARRVNPLLSDLLADYSYYWVTDQSEFATDVMFQDAAALQELYPKLLRHSTLCFSAEDVLTFLGKKLHGLFCGEVLNDCKSKIPTRSGRRLPGARVKHRMKQNWIKSKIPIRSGMYDKFGCVLRVETVINHPYDFKVRRLGKRKGEEVMGWYPMNKGVANLYRYAEVSLQANQRYLEALAAVVDPSEAYTLLDQLCQPVKVKGRSRRAFNPLAPEDAKLFAAVLRGEHALTGFRNAHVRKQLCPGKPKDPAQDRRRSARITRLLNCLHAHKLIAKIPHTRRYRVTSKGYSLMSAALHLRHEGILPLLTPA